ncbi:hypothetical protein [Oerskovia enterophila]|uniref:Uncharacterized protein n=1 Tax=Oerskovia enterophila TaxID=43678 RepID=A0A163QUD4_9CELL|nr:hypothetical protein [Oerskovia enterophila]KZM34543.1 hypothetical protein OJAG_28420 [Oerskovia enterophila]
MSAEGRAVEDALVAAVLASNPGAIVTGFVIVVEVATAEDPDCTAFVHDAAPGQSVAQSLGLLDVGLQYHRRRIGYDDE